MILRTPNHGNEESRGSYHSLDRVVTCRRSRHWAIPSPQLLDIDNTPLITQCLPVAQQHYCCCALSVQDAPALKNTPRGCRDPESVSATRAWRGRFSLDDRQYAKFSVSVLTVLSVRTFGRQSCVHPASLVDSPAWITNLQQNQGQNPLHIIRTYRN